MKEFVTDPQLLLGREVDPSSHPETTQEDLNAESLMLYDQELLIRYVGKHVGMMALKEQIESLEECDEEFWFRVFKKIIRTYSLNPLKNDLASVSDLDMKSNTIGILKDIKIRLLDDILEDKIKKDITREELEKYVIDNDYTKKFQWVIKYIDLESYEKFIKKIFKEFIEPLYDDSDDIQY